MDNDRWIQARQYTPEKLAFAVQVLEEIRSGRDVTEAIRKNPLPGGGYLGKHVLVAAYRHLVRTGAFPEDGDLLARIRLKPVRTLSGVTTVTVLTKPYPCPAECVFCPTEVRMPKSYIADEPGARRAVEHDFDPYEQVSSRLKALASVGHPTDKVELLILGGTWSAYQKDYQEWFLLRCFDALNEIESSTLEEAFTRNEIASHRNVGLVIETRPDFINREEIHRLRRLGVTKVQMGAQSMDDHILALNRRGHSTTDTQIAVNYLRAAGFKIVLHWMPNLLGATPVSDRLDFPRLWDELCPDEIKIYPNQLLKTAELFKLWQAGEFQPYTTEDLVALIADIKPTIPRYCRVNRVIRDIPSTYVVDGNKVTSLRQDVHREMTRRGQRCQCIRCREIGDKDIILHTLQKDDQVYMAGPFEEHFLSYNTTDDHLAGFLRLSIPNELSPQTGISDLEDAVIIREVHVYGQSLPVGVGQDGAAQHIGLGTRLIQWAEDITRQRGLSRLAVIAAVGTRRYYLSRGFERGISYMVKTLE